MVEALGSIARGGAATLSKPRCLCLFAGLLMVNIALAQTAPPNSPFNIAWQAYATAAESRDRGAMLEAAERAYVAADAELGVHDVRYPEVALNYGTLLLKAGETVLARSVIDEAVVRHEQQLGEESGRLIPIYLLAADANAREPHTGSQFAYARRAVDLSARLDGDASIEHANVLLRAGKNLHDGAWADHATKYLTAAHESYALHLGKDSLQAAEAAFHLGLIRFRDQEFRRAEPLFLAALGGFSLSNPIGRQRHRQTRGYLVRTYENLGDSGSATEHCVAIGEMQSAAGPAKPEPLYRFSASYPIKMLARRKEGFVDVGFTVDERGFVQDTRVVVTSGESAFDRAALAAVQQFRYAPAFTNGMPVATEHVRTRITFRLD